MRKKLWIHIGHFKTGTTALQVFCVTNRRKLAHHGVPYSTESLNHAKHSRLAFSLYRKAGVTTLMHGFADDTSPEVHWNGVLNELMSGRAPAALISSEEFMRLGSHPEAERILASIIAPWREKIDFRIIAYLRPPNSHLRSWYNQLIKMKEPVPDYNTAVTSTMEAVHYDYALALAPWRRIFGDESIRLRTYREEFKNNTEIFHDFLTTLGIECAHDMSGWKLPKRDVNPRMDDRLLEFARIANRIGLQDEAKDWLLKRIGDVLESRPDDGLRAFNEVCTRSDKGLEQLHAELDGLDLSSLQQDTPQPDPTDAANMELALEIALGEVAVLRRQHNRAFKDLSDRIEALERPVQKKRFLRNT